MPITLTIQRDQQSNELLAVYYQIRTGEVARTVELDTNCHLDLDDVNRPAGLELVGPFSLKTAKERASIYTCPELEQIFALLGGEPQLVRA